MIPIELQRDRDRQGEREAYIRRGQEKLSRGPAHWRGAAKGLRVYCSFSPLLLFLDRIKRT